MELAIQVRKMRRSPRGRARVLVDYPIYYLTIPEGKRDRRCSLTSDTCTIDDQYFFVRGCLELPVRDESDPFIWGVWVSVSQPSFQLFVRVYDQTNRSHVGPFFGWLQSHIRVYPETVGLKTRVHLRNGQDSTIHRARADRSPSRD